MSREVVLCASLEEAKTWRQNFVDRVDTFGNMFCGFKKIHGVGKIVFVEPWYELTIFVEN